MEMSNYVQVSMATYLFLWLYCDSRGHIVFATLMISAGLFFTNPVMFLREMTVRSVVFDFLLILTSLIAMCMFGMMITYILELHSRLTISNE